MDGNLKATNGDLQAVRIRIFDNDTGNEVYDCTSPLSNPKKELKDFNLSGFGGFQYHQLTLNKESEWIYGTHKIKMELFDITPELAQQLSENL